MNKRVKSVYFICLILFVGVIMTGCYSREERRQMRKYEKIGRENALKYIKKKYNFEPKIESINPDTADPGPIPDFGPSLNGDVFVDMSYKGKKFTVFITGEKESTEGYDDYQTDKIKKGILALVSDKLHNKPKKADFRYGWKGSRGNKYYLVSTFYDGTNLKEVLNNNDSFVDLDLIYIDDVNLKEASKDKELKSTLKDNKIYLQVYNFKDEKNYKAYKKERSGYITDKYLIDQLEISGTGCTYKRTKTHLEQILEEAEQTDKSDDGEHK